MEGAVTLRYGLASACLAFVKLQSVRTANLEQKIEVRSNLAQAT